MKIETQYIIEQRIPRHPDPTRHIWAGTELASEAYEDAFRLVQQLREKFPETQFRIRLHEVRDEILWSSEDD